MFTFPAGAKNIATQQSKITVKAVQTHEKSRK